MTSRRRRRSSFECISSWSNYLAPGINKGPFTAEEVDHIGSGLYGAFVVDAGSMHRREASGIWKSMVHHCPIPSRPNRYVHQELLVMCLSPITNASPVFRNGHLKRKLAAEGQVSMEPSLKPRVTHMDLPTPNGGMGHTIPRMASLEPPVPSGRSNVVSHVHEESHGAKRARTTTTTTSTTPHDLYSQIPNLSVLQNCRSLPYVIALAALLVELCEDDDPDTLCKVLGIANDLLVQKKSEILFPSLHRSSRCRLL